MDLEIFETILNDCLQCLLINNLLNDISIYNYDDLIKDNINLYVNKLDKTKAKRIIKYFGSIFDALKQVNDIDELLDTNSEITFYRNLASSCIYNNCFTYVNKLRFIDVINNHKYDNQSESKSETGTETGTENESDTGIETGTESESESEI